MRRLLFLAALGLALPAAAQTSGPDLATATRNLSAIWRPLPPDAAGPPDQIFATACAGALDELEGLFASLPEDAEPGADTTVRTTRALVLVPAADAGAVFVFPSIDMTRIAPGLGRFTVVNPAQARVDIADATGARIPVQIGQAGGRSLLRILWPGQPPQTFVGCASTLN